MKRILTKTWEFLTCVGWALGHGAEAELQYMLSKRTCPKCGHVRQRPTGCGPF